MSSVGSIEPDGILYACTKNVRMMIASTSAMIIASPYSRATDFCASAIGLARVERLYFGNVASWFGHDCPTPRP